jgi:hypothetical protein
VEKFLAMFAHHFFGAQAEQTLRGLVDADDMEALVVNEQTVRELVKDRFQDLGPLPFHGKMRHRVPCDRFCLQVHHVMLGCLACKLRTAKE